jgi:Myotubularin protein
MSGEEGSQEWTDRRIEDNFIESYVNRLFDNPLLSLSSHQKMTFGNLMRSHEERDRFSCCVSMKRQLQQVSEETVLSLQQHFALVLFECHQTDDFSTACSLMNMAFTYYFIDHQGRHIYPYMFLKDHQIFHDERFWNAAFFDSLDKLRSSKPLIPIGLSGTSPETLQREQSFLENITFGQLG